jgi:ribose 5-phosphate isomerase A
MSAETGDNTMATVMQTDQDYFKQQAAEFAVNFVRSGMVVGLGVGSTSIHAVRRLAMLLHSGELRNVVGVPCSLAVETEARRLGIPLATLEEVPAVDLTIDGADEVSTSSNALIKGGGGALLREKIVAQASRREIIIVDDSKLSPLIGMRWSLPVEVLPFGMGSQQRFLAALGAEITTRRDANGKRYVTDQGNMIFDCRFGPIANPTELASWLDARAGIIGHGLFLCLMTDLVVAGPAGVRHEEIAR